MTRQNVTKKPLWYVLKRLKLPLIRSSPAQLLLITMMPFGKILRAAPFGYVLKRLFIPAKIDGL